MPPRARPHVPDPREPGPKAYDRAYFDRWYRSREAVTNTATLRRKVHLALSVAEFVIDRQVRSVLDVGCGEAPWRPLLKRMRPRISYVGVDSSAYAVQRFGRRRGIRAGSLGTLHRMKFDRMFDLIICSDVLQYVDEAEMKRGLRTIRKLLGGVAYIEAFPDMADFTGDFAGWHQRSERSYRKAFADAGLVGCGMSCWIGENRLDRLGIGPA